MKRLALTDAAAPFQDEAEVVAGAREDDGIRMVAFGPLRKLPPDVRRS